MPSYPIGTIAAHVLAVTFGRDGTVTPTLKHRAADGRLTSDNALPYLGGIGAGGMDFVVRVRQGDSGVIEIRPASCPVPQARAIIPLGSARPFLGSELPPSAGANGAFTLSEFVAFHLTPEKLTWANEDSGGCVNFSADVVSLSVALRLPSGNHGEITFPPSVMFDVSGKHVSTLVAC